MARNNNSSVGNGGNPQVPNGSQNPQQRPQGAPRDFKYEGIPANRAGIQPDLQAVRYTITTNQMRAYVQTKLDAVISTYNEAVKGGKIQNGMLCPKIFIKMSTCKLSDQCLPVICVLPDTAEVPSNAKPYNQQQQNSAPQNSGRSNIGNTEKTKSGVVDIERTPQFNEGGVSGGIRIHDPIYKLLSEYMYSSPKYITSTEFKSMNNLSTQAAEFLKNDCRFRRLKSKKRHESFIVIWLDPFAIAHQMLEWPSDNRPFNCSFLVSKKSDKKAQGQFVYNVCRELQTGNKKHGGGGDDRNATMDFILNG